MEQLLIYLLKSSGLIAAFFLSYHFLVRKDTFFNSNRWFLLGGLLTSVLLPFYFIEKIIVVLVERPKIPVQDFVVPTQLPIQEVPVVAEAFDWMQFVWVSYIIIAAAFIIRIVLNLISLYRMLRQHQVIKNESFKLIDINENLTPFSFFGYIVFNSGLYSVEELENILLHEKIHSKQKHSIDVLIAEIFCALFWFNPFIWLYKKAITQNLEYIADQKAVGQSENKKSYQHALLKVVSNQNCLPITNNFYQSLIKKRIIMLNKNQSHRTSYLKYAVVIPVVFAFVFLFQVKVTAMNKIAPEVISDNPNTVPNQPIAALPEEAAVVGNGNDIDYVFDKITTDKDLDESKDILKKDYNIDLTITYVKRNSKGEIISIKMAFDDKKGNTGKVEQIRDIPIRPIFFQVKNLPNGKMSIGFYDNHEMVNKPADPVNEGKITTIESIKDDALIYVDGMRFTKEDLNELDPKGLEKIELVTDAPTLAKYGAKDKGMIVLITSNWSTRQDPPKPNAPNIITIANGDEVVVYDRFNMKIPGYPTVQFTESSPILVINGVQKSNPRLILESMNLSKIKDIKVLNENEKEVKGTPISKVIITLK